MMDTWPDDRDIESWRQAYRHLQGRGSPSCPSDDRLIALVLHEHACAEREQLADHIVSCRRCTDLYQLLLRVHRDLIGAHPDPAPSKLATTTEKTDQTGSEREDEKAPEPPQKAAGPQHHRS